MKITRRTEEEAKTLDEKRVNSSRIDSLLLTGIYIWRESRVLLGFSHSYKKKSLKLRNCHGFGFWVVGLQMGPKPKQVARWFRPLALVEKMKKRPVFWCSNLSWQTTSFMRGQVKLKNSIVLFLFWRDFFVFILCLFLKSLPNLG